MGELKRSLFRCAGECGATLNLEGEELALIVKRVTPTPKGAVMFLEGGTVLFWSDMPPPSERTLKPGAAQSTATGLATRAQICERPFMFCKGCGWKIVTRMIPGGGFLNSAMSMFGMAPKAAKPRK